MVAIARSMLTQVIQMGVEPAASPGTGGTPDQRLGTFNSQIAPVAAGAFGVFRPSAGKYVGQIVPTDIYAEGAVTDTIDFNSIPFLGAMNIGWVAGSPLTAPAVKWVNTPIPFAVGTQRTFNWEEGVSGAVYHYNWVGMPDFNMRFMRTGASQAGGRVLGKKQNPGVTLTTAGALIAGRSITGLNTGIWEADTFDHLTSGGTPTALVPTPLDLSWRNNGVFAPWFGMDPAIVSYAGLLEGAADCGIQITLLADVDVDDIFGVFNYSNMEVGERIYLKVFTFGPIITGVIPYSLELDLCAEISAPPRRTAQGNLRAWQWDALCVPNAVGTDNVPFRLTTVGTLPVAAIA